MKLCFLDMWEGHWQSTPTHRIIAGLHAKCGNLEIVDDHRRANVVIASVFGNKKRHIPAHKLCVYTGENTRPNPKAALNVGFDFRDDPYYIRLPLWYLSSGYPVEAAGTITEGFFERPRMIATMVGNPNCQRRNDVIAAFGDSIASGGPHMNNVGGHGGEKQAFMATAKFGLAFENTVHPGYCTEKIIQARAAGCIPVYWGDTEVSVDINPEAILNVQMLQPADVVDVVRRASEDEPFMREMLTAPFFTHGAVERADAAFDQWMTRLAQTGNS